MPDPLTTLILFAHAAATWFMVGLIWFVQVVHYPLMARVPASEAAAYALEHQRKTTWIVAPVMCIEAFAAVLLTWPLHVPSTFGHLPGVLGLTLLALIWLSTFAVQVPLHARLAASPDDRTVRRLVASNWVRTLCWTARGSVAMLLLVRV
ncbi:MAG: hypothetical protein ACK4WH_05660 [Phycisphaerales bacterium]